MQDPVINQTFNQSDSWNVGVAFLTGQVKAGWASGKKVHVIPVVNVEVSTPSKETQKMRLEHLETKNWLDSTEQQLMKDNKKQDKQKLQSLIKLRIFVAGFCAWLWWTCDPTSPAIGRGVPDVTSTVALLPTKLAR